MCGRSREPPGVRRRVRGAIGGLKLCNLKSLKGRSRKTGSNMDQDDGHGNVELNGTSFHLPR